MVSPADGWEDVEDGLQKEDVKIEVAPLDYVEDDGFIRSQAVEFEKANAYEVAIRQLPQRHQEIVTFDDPKKAWEFVHLLTHYIDARTADGFIGNMKNDWMGEVGPLDLVTDRSARETLEAMVGYATGPIDDLDE